MSLEENLKLCNLSLELKLERCDDLVKEYEKSRSNDDSQSKLITNNGSDKRLKKDELPGVKKQQKKSPKLCWGCLEEGNLKNMHVPRRGNGLKEKYADMVNYCFSIKLKKNVRINYICDSCIEKLREVLRFKQQISIAQNYLNQLTGGPTVKPVYTGQEEIPNNNPSSPQKMDTTMESTPINISPISVYNQGGQANPFPMPPLRLFPVQPSTFVLNTTGEKHPVVFINSKDIDNKLTPINNQTYVNIKPQNHQNMIFLAGNSNKLLTCTLKPALDKYTPVKVIKAVQASKPSQNIINLVHEVPDSSDDDDVQVIEDDDNENTLQNSTADSNINSWSSSFASMDQTPTPHTIDNNYFTDNVDTFNNSSNNIYAQEDYTESDYVTSMDYDIPKENPSDSIEFEQYCYCPICRDAFTSISDRREHLRLQHAEETTNNHMCEECGTKLAHKRSLNRHIKDTHLKKKTYICSLCGFATNQKNAYRLHLNTHIGLNGN